MIILSITDIHSDITVIDEFSDILKSADLLLITGDITNFGKEDEISRIINAFRTYCPVLAVAGNCDQLPAKKWLKSESVSLDGTIRKFRGLTLSGLDSLTEEKHNLQLPDIKAGKPEIFISHQPPANTKIDSPDGSYHMGSETVRKIIETYKPLLAFAGHVHEAAGIDKIGNTIIANPGPFPSGGYVYVKLDLTGSSPEVKLCQIRNFLNSQTSTK